MQKITINDRMESAAEYGLMEIDLFLWKHAIEKLEKNGLTITKMFPSTRKGEYYCRISWKEKVEGKAQVNNLHDMAEEAILRK